MNQEHVEKVGIDCKYKHYLYQWEGRLDSKVCLISDSLCKWVQNIDHLDVQALPGLKLSPAFVKMCSHEVRVDGYKALIFHIGTNDYAEGTPLKEIVQKMAAILCFAKQSHPGSRLAVSLILPRPQDNSMAKDRERRKLNSMLKKLCKREGVTFANCIAAATTRGVVDRDLFEDDLLHLNALGIAKLGAYYQGLAASLMERIPPMLKKPKGEQIPTVSMRPRWERTWY